MQNKQGSGSSNVIGLMAEVAKLIWLQCSDLRRSERQRLSHTEIISQYAKYST